MIKKISNLTEQRRKKPPRSLEEVAEMAVRRYFDPALLATLEEPVNFASGKTMPDGSFVSDTDDEIDDENIHEAR